VPRGTPFATKAEAVSDLDTDLDCGEALNGDARRDAGPLLGSSQQIVFAKRAARIYTANGAGNAGPV